MKLQYALVLHQQGQLEHAQKLYEEVLREEPKNFDALHLLGVLHTKRQNLTLAKKLIRQAIDLNPSSSLFYYNYGIVQDDLKEHQGAISSYEQAISLGGDKASCFYNRGNSFQSLKQYEAAIASYDQAIVLQPTYAQAFASRGSALKEARLYDAAIASCKEAIRLSPKLAEAYNNLGNVLLKLKQPDEALAQYEHALDLKADYAEAHFNRGAALALLKKLDAAIASYERAIDLKPLDAKAYFHMGNVYFAKRRPDAAMQCFERVLTMDAVVADEIDYGQGRRLHAKQLLCDWTNIEQEFTALLNKLDDEDDAKVVMPFELLAMPSNGLQQKRCAESYVVDDFFAGSADYVPARKLETRKIRIGYFSSDFRDHPVGQLSIGLIESHDRISFEVYGLGLMPTDTSAIGNRFVKAFDRLIDLSGLKLSEAVGVARALELDIAINLNGHTEHNRNELFDHRVAPVQVNYLGYAGTLGATFMDYILADNVVVPIEQEGFYTEKIARLPHSFFPSSYARQSLESISIRPAKQEQGLPEQGFIFACFNNCYKITPDIFDVWMRLLKQVEGSVLWLSKQPATAMRNLQQEARKRGVAPERLVFATRMDSHAAHLARLRLADLFLDTRYYNAHTTAADALWAGLPVLTYAGWSFASRVAASLLSAVGLQGMIAPSMTAYESMALELANDAVKLQSIKDKLNTNRLTAPLFDIALTTKHLEHAYEQMHVRHLRGLKPESFDVVT